MSGFFSLLALGLDPALPARWLRHFVIAWPVAFCLSIVVSKVAFDLAFRIRARLA
jgi:hypothetical protein